MNPEVIQIQIALFFKQDFAGEIEKVSLKIKEKLGDSVSTQVFPLPEDAPSEIPRLSLSYKDFKINFSKNRADLFFKDMTGESNEIIEEVIKIILDELELEIGRIGFIKHSFRGASIGQIKELIKDNSKLSGLKEISLRVNIAEKIKDFSCNNIESLTSGFVIKKDNGREEKQEGILVDRDINTLPEEIGKNAFNAEMIKLLVGEFNNKSDKYMLLSDEQI